MSNSNLTVSLVLGSNGKIDMDATAEAFADQLSRHVESVELEGSAIEEAVLAVIDQCNRPTSMTTIAGLAAARLNAQPENHGTLTARAMEYIQNNSQGKKLADGSVERPNSLLVSSRGPNGGTETRSRYETRLAATEATKGK